jgi:hypothetical protein
MYMSWKYKLLILETKITHENRQIKAIPELS